MLEWLQVSFGIGSGLILALAVFALALGIIDALSVRVRLWWLLRKRAREEG
jgi:hypothetical protein